MGIAISKLLPWALAVVLLGAVGTIGYIKGNSACQIANAKAMTKAVNEGNKDYEVTKKKVLQLNDADLDARLDRWLR